MARRSAESGPRMCSWPTNWSSAAGRMRTGSGCSAAGTRVRVLAGFSSPASNSCSTLEFWQQQYWKTMPGLEQRTTELLQRLIQFNTVNPPGNEEAAQEFLKETLEEAGFECELLAAVEGRPNLVARLRAASDGPRLALLGHVDTVLADADDWSVDPWAGGLRDGCVWGRGALDMKGQVAAEVAAAVSLASEGWRPESGELLVIVTADEEVGAAHGAKWLCEQMPDHVRCDFVVNEGGGPSFSFGDKRYYLVEVGEKGVFRFTLTTRGAAGHASMPRIGDNALVKLAPFIDAMADGR